MRLGTPPAENPTATPQSSRTIWLRRLSPMLLVAFVVLVVFTQRQTPPELRRDDPAAREAWEFTRLRDPRTNRIPEGIRARELSFAATLPAVEQLPSFGKNGRARAQTWTARGPNNQGGRTRALAIDVADNSYNTLFAGGASGGVWRTTNGGSSWTRVTSVEDHPSVTSIAQDTRTGKTGIWYYGTGENGSSASGGDASYLGRGVWKSTNGGTTWSLLASTAASEFNSYSSGWQVVYTVDTDPSNAAEDEVYAANADGVFRSIDGGTTWTHVLGVTNSQGFSDVKVLPSGVVYATLGSAYTTQAAGPASAPGIWRSPDGLTWTRLSAGSGFPESNAQRIELDAQQTGPNEVAYFLANAPGAPGNVKGGVLWHLAYNTGTATPTWTNRTANVPNPGDPGTSNFQFDPQSNYNIVVAMKPGDPTFVIVGGTNLYRSTDGFVTAATTEAQITQMHIGGYAPLTGFSDYPSGHPDHHAVVFYPNNSDRVLVGDDGGVRRTESISRSSITQVTVNETPRNVTVLWSPLNTNYATTQFYSVALDPAPTVASGTANVVIGGLQDNGTLGTYSIDPAVNWREALGGDGTVSGVGAAGAFYLSGTQNGGINRHTLTLNQVDPFAPNQADIKPGNALAGGSSYLFVSPNTLDPANPNRLYFAAGSRLWRNSDVPTATTSTGWSNLSTAEVSGTRISAIGVSKATDRLYYGTENGELYRLDSPSASTTPARTDVFTGKGFNAGAYVSSIVVNPANGNHVIVVFSNYGVRSIYMTADAGATWTHVSGNLEQNADGTGNGPSVRWVAMMPVGGGIMYFAGTSVGLYSTIALSGVATVWAKEGTGIIGNTPVNMIATRSSDGVVAVATHGNGIFSSAVTVLPVELLSFSAQVRGRDARLTWTTAAETNNAGFYVEQVQGPRWDEVAFVSGNGTTAEQHTYLYTVSALSSGRHTFRLRQVDFDGATHYSPSVEVTINLDVASTLEVRGESVRFSVRETQPVRVEIYDVVGRRIATLFNSEMSAGQAQTIAVPVPLASGIYIVRLTGNAISQTASMLVR